MILATEIPGVMVRTAHDLRSVREQWTELAEQTGNVFSTWEWAEAWRRHLAPQAEIAPILATDRDGPLALLPLYIARRRPLRLARLIGSGPADELGPVLRSGAQGAALAALAPALGEVLGGQGVFLGERLPSRIDLAGALGAEVVHRIPSPVLELGARSFEEFLADRSRNFRSQVRRHERRLRREHRLNYRLTSEPELVERDMRTLARLHAARWQEGHTEALTGARAAFHLEFARVALGRGWLRLWTMELDGRPVAAWYGFRYGGIESYYQAGRDPRCNHLNVGFVLLCHTIRCAFEDGMREYRFGVGGEDYKARFCDDRSSAVTAAIGRGARGRLAVSALKTAVRLPPAYRTRVRAGARRASRV